MAGDTIRHQQYLLFAGVVEFITMSSAVVTSAVPVELLHWLTRVTWVPLQFTVASMYLAVTETSLQVPDVGESFTHWDKACAFENGTSSAMHVI